MITGYIFKIQTKVNKLKFIKVNSYIDKKATEINAMLI